MARTTYSSGTDDGIRMRASIYPSGMKCVR